MSFAELQFILAEAVVRGWISGDASEFYKKGIRASLEFSNYGNAYTSDMIDAYVSKM